VFDFQLWRTDPGGVRQRPDTSDCQVIGYVLKKYGQKNKNPTPLGQGFFGGGLEVKVVYTLFPADF